MKTSKRSNDKSINSIFKMRKSSDLNTPSSYLPKLLFLLQKSCHVLITFLYIFFELVIRLKDLLRNAHCLSRTVHQPCSFLTSLTFTQHINHNNNHNNFFFAFLLFIYLSYFLLIYHAFKGIFMLKFVRNEKL